MKTVNKSCEVVCFFDKNGNIMPRRIRINDSNGAQQTIIINKSFKKYEGKIDGMDCIVYRCQSNIENESKIFELKFNKNKMQWILFKI